MFTSKTSRAKSILMALMLASSSLVLISCGSLDPDDYEWEGEISVEGESKKFPNGTREDSIKIGGKIKIRPKSKTAKPATQEELRNLLVEALDDFMQPFGYIRKIGDVTWSGNTASVSAAATGPSASVRGELARIENLALDYGLVVTKQIPTIQVWEAEQ